MIPSRGRKDKKMSADESLSAYLQYFFSRYLPNLRGLPPTTIASYKQSWALFLQFLLSSKVICSEKDPQLKDIEVSHILRFLEYLESRSSGRGNKVSTRNNRLAAIKSFFHAVHLIAPKHQKLCEQVFVIPTKKTRRPVADYLGKEEINAIFSQIDTKSSQGFRDMTILRLLYNTGARISEIAGLKRSDLDLTYEKQVRILGKGGKERICPLWDSTVAFVSIYLKSERKAPKRGYEQYLFINQRGEPFTRFGLWRLIMKYVKKAGTKVPTLAKKHISAHSFRHTTAVHLLQSGVDINVISDWLGHGDISATTPYLHIDMSMKRKALQKFNWLERLMKDNTHMEKPDWKDMKQVSKWLDLL
jgi:site-specific recombinase XerD